MSNVTNIKKQKYTAEELLIMMMEFCEDYGGVESITIIGITPNNAIIASTIGDDEKHAKEAVFTAARCHLKDRLSPIIDVDNLVINANEVTFEVKDD